MLEYENYKKNKFIEENSYKLGEKMNKPQTKKLDRIEKSLTDNIAMIESILEGLKSDFNYIKNMPDCSVEKEKGVIVDNQLISENELTKYYADIRTANISLPSFVEVVHRLKKLEDDTYNHLTDIDRRLKKLEI